MTHQRLSWLACLVVLLGGVLPRAAAEIDTLEEKLNRSHLLDGEKFGLPSGTTEELFLQRLKSIHTKEIGEGVGKDLKRAELDRLMQNQDLVKDFLEKFKFEQLPLALQKKFESRKVELEAFIRSMDTTDFLKYAQQAQGLQPLSNAGEAQPDSDAATQSTPSTSEPGAGSSPSERESREDAAASEASPDDQQANSVLGRWLLRAANRLKDLDPAIRDSPAVRRMVRELSHNIEGADDRWKAIDNGANAFAEKWARLAQTLPLDRLLPEGGLSWPRSLTGDSLPKWRLPDMGPRSGRLGPSHFPGGSMSDWTGEEGWRALWMLILLTLLGLVLWRTVGRGAVRALDQGDAWKLGPWPVDPSAVRTREELIQAFEYLSVLRLGPAARFWHHWAIASGLGQSSAPTLSASGWNDGSPERRRAAEQLAVLYEQARYAPTAEPLPEATLVTARRDLCLLAGVPLS